jgi:branched-chain amino acid transport system substrate-binding protein
MKRILLVGMLVSVLVLSGLFDVSLVQAASSVDLSKAPRTIKIGACFSITGAFAGFYRIMGDWEDNLVKVINERGGIYVKEYNTRLPIKVIWHDDRSDPTTTAKFYEKLITVDKVDFLIGPTASPPAMSGSAVAEKYKIPMFLTSSIDPKIFNRGFKWITCCHDTALSWATRYFEMIRKQTDAKTVALFAEDTVWASGIAIGARDIIKNYGFNLVFDKLAPADTKDFTSVIMELKNVNADVIYIPAFAPFFVTFMKQAITQGLKPKALHGSAGISSGFLEAMGEKGTNYITGDHMWVPQVKYEGYDVMNEIIKRSKINILEWPFGPTSNFSTHQIMFKAIEHAGTLDRNKVQEALETSSFMTIGGPWHRQPNGAGTHPPFTLQNIDGKVHSVYPPEIATHKFEYPIPWK